MIALDTETTGLDIYHGARPFLVTICDEEGDNAWWEWGVDPLTRKVRADADDLREIQMFIDENEWVVLQNPKFDYAALHSSFADHGMTLRWDWGKVYDTLLAGHLLASNQPHDLTTMALVYLHLNIQPLEDALEEAVKKAKMLAPKDWRLGKKGLPEMPSARDKTWKFDQWLPRAVARERDLEEDHPWWTVCSDYANGDSATTIALFKQQRKMLRERDLWRIYEERLKLLPIVSDMESRGVTVSSNRVNELQKAYGEDSVKHGRICINIAASYGYELSLPKSGCNNSLRGFCFSEDGLNLPRYVGGKPKETEAPSLDKGALEHYEAILAAKTKALTFVRSLRAKRKRDTALSYMESYERFWLPHVNGTDDVGDLWKVLHPSLNPTGTDTLRWSSSNPNEQNISKQGIDVHCPYCEDGAVDSGGVTPWGKSIDVPCPRCNGSGIVQLSVRYAFGPAPGREWWSMDAQNIELRIPAYESGEQELIDLFERPDDPPYYGSVHLLNFHTVYPDIWTKELREVGEDKVGLHCKKKYRGTWYQWCKNGGFAVQYGAVERTGTDSLLAEGTADRAFHRRGSHARLKARFGKLEALNQKWIAHAERNGYVETLPDKTVDPKRGYPLRCTRTKWGRVLPTVPLNYHVQSTACWWMMKAMIRCYARIEEWRQEGFDAAIVMQVHDELVFDFPRGKSSKSNLARARELQKLMAAGGKDIGVPTPVSIEYHVDNWDEGVVL